MAVIMLLTFAGANYYVFNHLWRLMPASPIGRTILIAFATLVLGSLILYFAARNHLPETISGVIYRIGTNWIIIFAYLIMAFLLLDIMRLTKLVLLEWLTQGSWLGLAGLVGAVAIIMTIGNITYHNKKRTEVNIATDKLAHGKEIRIVAVSDLHLGYSIGRKEIARWAELINKENPDAVIIGGDLIDADVRPLHSQNMAEAFGAIKPKYGIYAVPGNHEYISGIEQSLDFFRKAGMVVLKDSAELVDEEFYIVGRDDRTNTARESINELTENLDRSKPIILIDHQPYDLGEAESAGIDVQFSGHTHRGQIWPASMVTDAIFEDSYGLLRKGNTSIYVSSGLGIWGGKFRIGTRSEYVVITLRGE